MNLLLIGSDYFLEPLTRLGHRVAWIDSGRTDPHAPDILASLPFRPQALILTDDLGHRILPSGLNEIEIITVWYGVDGPLNHFWHQHWAPLFDLTLVDQKDSAERLAGVTPVPPLWLPVAADFRRYQGPEETKTCDLAFVGEINPRVRPKRSRILERLGRRYNLVTAGGRDGHWLDPEETGRLYRRARIVLNENLFPGVTTRMFEAMASGTMLLTEAGSPGLTDLFVPARDLATYQPDDLLDQVDYYLSRPGLRVEMGAQGRALARTEHDVIHRAGRLVELIESARPGRRLAGPLARREEGLALTWCGLRWPGPWAETRLKRAERLLFAAPSDGPERAGTDYVLGILAGHRGSLVAARARLAASAEAGDCRADIGLGYLALQGGDSRQARNHFRKATQNFGVEFPGYPNETLSAAQHVALARTLNAAGWDLTPGFSRTHLAPPTWTALEHYQAAVRTDPGDPAALAGLGRLLMRFQAHTEAYEFLARAAALHSQDQELAAEAGRRGYILPELERKVA